MKAASTFAGHTVHGSRRGSMQHDDAFVLGKSLEEVGGPPAQIGTESIVKRYLDPHRHLYQWMGADQG